MTIDVQELLLRVRDLEIEALAALDPAVEADAVEYLMHTQEAFPYFVNRVSGLAVTNDSEDFEVYTYQVTMRLVTAHATEGYVGEPESDLYLYIPQVVNYFNSRRLLQTTGGDYDTAMTHLMEAQITNNLGFTIFQNAGISASQVGTEFTLTAVFEEEISQAFN